MLPDTAAVIADALAKARIVRFSSDGTSAAGSVANGITQVIPTVLAAQLVGKAGVLGDSGEARKS
jgi:hypothetical protein